MLDMLTILLLARILSVITPTIWERFGYTAFYVIVAISIIVELWNK